MKKIALIAYDLNPMVGSECRSAYLWLKILAKYYQIDAFVCSVHQDDLENEHFHNVRFIFIPVPGCVRLFASKTGLYFISVAFFMRKCKLLLRNKSASETYDVLHFLTPAGVHSFINCSKVCNVPYIIGPLGGGLPTPVNFKNIFKFKEKFLERARIFLYRYMQRNPYWQDYINHACKVIIGTQYLAKRLPMQATNHTHIIFDTVVDITEFEMTKREKEADCIKIVYSGKLSPIKGILMLVDAIKLVKAKTNAEIFSKLQFIIYGDGPLKERVKNKIVRFGLSNSIILCGHVYRAELIRALKQSDIFCLPTIRENGGGSILEAMAAGLPIITSDYGGPKYSVTEECGIKIKVDDYDQYVNDLAEAIIKLASDESLRLRMGRNARKRVEEEFSLEALEKKVIKIYEEVLNGE